AESTAKADDDNFCNLATILRPDRNKKRRKWKEVVVGIGTWFGVMEGDRDP
ncbi:unnamed protein product, partial [Sphenostylis stenocarpa]